MQTSKISIEDFTPLKKQMSSNVSGSKSHREIVKSIS